MSTIGDSTLTAATTSYNSEDYEELVEALQGIATEILRFQDPCCQASFHAKYANLPRCKSDTNTSTDKNILGKYCENLKVACNAAAKMVGISNNYQTPAENNQMTVVKCESNKMLHDRDKCVDLINKLTRESIVSSVKREVLHAFILLGYRELQKLRHEPEEDIGIAMKLKHIIVACGQYYADYCNEHQRRVRVENKNERLLDKLKILRNHLGAVNYLKEEVKHLKTKNEELKRALKLKTNAPKKKNCMCRVCDKKPSSATIYTYAELGGHQYSRNATSKIIKRQESFCLGNHLTVIKNLIDEQENMMTDLLQYTQNLTKSDVTL